ncbi:MAG: type II toxin-antitoxin system HicB family antitoxin [Phycisphaerales bacterium]
MVNESDENKIPQELWDLADECTYLFAEDPYAKQPSWRFHGEIMELRGVYGFGGTREDAKRVVRERAAEALYALWYQGLPLPKPGDDSRIRENGLPVSCATRMRRQVIQNRLKETDK